MKEEEEGAGAPSRGSPSSLDLPCLTEHTAGGSHAWPTCPGGWDGQLPRAGVVSSTLFI